MVTFTKASWLSVLVGLLAIFFAGAFRAQAQDCGCDHVIGPDKSYIRASDMPTVQPGDVICIQAGVRGRLVFRDFAGTPEQPLIFKNCGGQVIFDHTNTATSGALIFDKCSYFRLTGTGDPGEKYGFFIRTVVSGSALSVSKTDFEIDHVEIADSDFAGILSKIDPDCNNPQYHKGNFVMKNVSIHDNYIRDLPHGEGMYIGSSWFNGLPYESVCNGDTATLYPHEIHGLRIYDNVLTNIGADGIQVGCATQDVEVYNNTIDGYGLRPFKPVHINGIQIGGGTTGKWYNNKIMNGAGMGIQCLGLGNLYMFNNLIVNSAGDGIYINDKNGSTGLLLNSFFAVDNNTIVSPGNNGISMFSELSRGNTFINNLVVAPGSLGNTFYGGRNGYIYIENNNVDYTANNNLHAPTLNDAGFAAPAAGDYQLTAGSPAVNAGANLGYFAFDHTGSVRPVGGAFDIGAYEYGSTPPPPPPGDEYTVRYRINSGGGLQADTVKDWEADNNTTRHAFLDPASALPTTGSTGSFDARRPNTTGVPAAVLGTSRYVGCCGSNIQYLIPTDAGKQYKINLYFANKNAETGILENQRKFEVRINGTLVATVDMAWAGDGVYTVSKELAVQQTAATATVTLVPLVGQAQVNAIEVLERSDAPAPPPAAVLLHRLNVNGEEMAGTPVWQADGYYTPHPFYDTNHATSGTGSTGSFSGTRKNPTPVPAAALGTYRHTITSRGDIIQYNIPVDHPGSAYTVNLYFALKGAEVGLAAGQRVFDVIIEGEVVRENFDVSVAADSAYGLSFTRVVNDGVLTFSLVKKVGEAQLNAFEIYGPAASAARTARAEVALKGKRSGRLFPNPAREYVYVQAGKGKAAELVLYNSMGTRLGYRATQADGGKVKVAVQSLAAGFYYLQLRYADGTTETHRFVKQ